MSYQCYCISVCNSYIPQSNLLKGSIYNFITDRPMAVVLVCFSLLLVIGICVGNVCADNNCFGIGS